MHHSLQTCKHCQILFEKDKEYCPVCSASNRENAAVGRVDEKQEQKIRTSKRRIFLILSLCMTLIPCIVVMTIDFLLNKSITWSPLVVLPLCTAYLYVWLFVRVYKAPFILGMNVIILTLLFLNILNTLLGTHWFIVFGLPLALGIPIIGYIIFVIINKYRHKGLNVIATLLLGISFMLMYVEFVYSYFVDKRIHLSWSLVVTLSCVPVALVLLYLHKHRTIIERWIHL